MVRCETSTLVIIDEYGKKKGKLPISENFGDEDIYQSLLSKYS